MGSKVGNGISRGKGNYKMNLQGHYFKAWKSDSDGKIKIYSCEKCGLTLELRDCENEN